MPGTRHDARVTGGIQCALTGVSYQNEERFRYHV
jgi:hypothetical protein